MEKNKIAIFASGSGTNAQNIFRHAKKLRLEVTALICDNPSARVIPRAKSFGVPVYIIPFEGSRKDHERQIIEVIHGVDWILLAGYMRILSVEFVKEFFDHNLNQSRIINIHPSLLPKYPGLDSYKRSFEAKDEKYGATLHYVDEGVDTGRIIEQGKIARDSYDSFEEYVAKGMQLEYQLYRNFLEKLSHEYTAN